jgi:hypothetical protein
VRLARSWLLAVTPRHQRPRRWLGSHCPQRRGRDRLDHRLHRAPRTRPRSSRGAPSTPPGSAGARHPAEGSGAAGPRRRAIARGGRSPSGRAARPCALVPSEDCADASPRSAAGPTPYRLRARPPRDGGSTRKGVLRAPVPGRRSRARGHPAHEPGHWPSTARRAVHDRGRPQEIASPDHVGRARPSARGPCWRAGPGAGQGRLP